MLRNGIGRLSCRFRYDRLLSAYVDEALTELDARIVAEHLRGCKRCRREQELLTFSKNALVKFEIPVSRGQWTGGNLNVCGPRESTSLLRRLCKQRIAIPLPLAAALLIAFVSTTLFAFHSWTISSPQAPVANDIQATPSTLGAHNQTVKVVEVPVERVVTRFVYIKGSKRKANQLPPLNPGGNLAKRSSNNAGWSSNQLESFRPAASANLRVLKEPER